MSELEEYCCVCVKKQNNLENINEIDNNSTRYKDKLVFCSKEQEWPDYYNICKNCIIQLDLAYQFVKACKQSEELRKEQLKLIEEQKIKDKSFNCHKCNREFKHKRSLTIHLKRSHKTQKLLENESDFNECISQEELTNDEFTDSCENIPYFIQEDTNIPNKKSYVNNKISLTCEYCGKIFNRRQHYSAHIRSKHTFEKPYKCNICDARYTTSHSLLVHKRNHNNERPFVCTACGKSFVCSGDLYHHGKIHLNKREYKCSTCEKSFNTASILRTHKICMHSDPKHWKYVCKTCDKHFPIKSNLVTHQKRHAGIKEFTCHICDKKFFDKAEVSRHLKCHSNERPFKCGLCEGKEYKTNYGLKKHMKIVHDKGTITIVKPEKKYACSQCPRVFAFNNKLQKHMYTHTGDKPFKCQLCKKGFIENYYRRLHMQKKHNVQSVD
ncbi:unnamed protein product [Phyllotreta striolata]|uniref:C2H2-type domain-containing protein n=1 Tax=Phyllotreta striolata TaxID=444603 RepID=A0A9N9XTC0_PHYSR|nr:unnamed protein product [Phyllotreta striolata]